MTKVSVYVLLRVLYFVLRTEGAAQHALTLLGWASAVAILAGSLLALAQRDIRRMLAYSSVGQIAYIILGITLATPAAMLGALLHILNHAVMKGCLFLVVGGVQWRTGHNQIPEFTGMGRRMPLTMAAFVVAALSMIGIPPTAGFFSKWYLLTGALEARDGIAVAVLIASSLLSAGYFFRVFAVAYFSPPEVPTNEPATLVWRQELPGSMLGPIAVLALAILALGLWNQSVIRHVIQPALPQAL
jgi:multicomponent Na+:H+ antiporter subunit D